MRRGKRAARAAALLLIASGVSGVSASLFPRLDERWIFVAAVALIGGFGGIVIGILSAIAAVGCYELMRHSTLSFTPERDTLLLLSAIAAAMAARGWRVSAERPRSVVPRPLPLPPAPTAADDADIA